MKESLEPILKKYTHANHPSCLILTGSHLYGVANESSDEDYRGFVLPTYDQLVGLDQFDQWEQKEPDVVVYNFKKFVDLLLKGSPNMTELLFVPEENVLISDFVHRGLVLHRESFMSKSWISAYIGFATQAYLEWDKSGDVKKLYHCIRILSQLKDLLLYKNINFKDQDRIKLLISIRNGSISKHEAEITFNKLINEIRNLENFSDFPQVADLKGINNIKRQVFRYIINRDIV